MPTYTALTTLSAKDSAQSLAAAMERLAPEPTGIGVLEVEDGTGVWEVGGYFTDPPDPAGLALLAQVFGAREFVVSRVPDTDWVAHVKRELAPVAAGRFFVFGSHDADKVPAGVVPLLIEAAMAFGTGHHGTTKGCLLALETLTQNGLRPKAVADIGCGTAVLAMAAAKIWPKAEIVAGDIDPVAVETAAANVVANGLAGVVRCHESTGFDHADLSATPFDLVFANILMGPLIGLAADMVRRVAVSGVVILSGILNDQADEVIDVYAAQGFALRDRLEIGEWSTLTLAKTTA